MIINGTDFGLGADAVLRSNARDLMPSGWGALAPAEGVFEGTLAPADGVMDGTLEPAGVIIQAVSDDAKLMVANTPGAPGCAGWSSMSPAAKQVRANAHAAWSRRTSAADLLAQANLWCTLAGGGGGGQESFGGIGLGSRWGDEAGQMRRAAAMLAHVGISCSTWPSFPASVKQSYARQWTVSVDIIDRLCRQMTGVTRPGGDVMVSDAPDRAANYGAANVFPAGDPPALSPEQAAYVRSRSTMWGALGAVLGAAMSGGVCWWMCKSRANPDDSEVSLLNGALREMERTANDAEKHGERLPQSLHTLLANAGYYLHEGQVDRAKKAMAAARAMLLQRAMYP